MIESIIAAGGGPLIGGLILGMEFFIICRRLYAL